jgi:hypothetical protein
MLELINYDLGGNNKVGSGYMVEYLGTAQEPEDIK